MSRLRLQIIVLALAVCATSAQCLVACATEFCHDSKLPPCHRHHQPKQPQTCVHAIFVAEARADTVIQPQSIAPAADLPVEGFVRTLEVPRPGPICQGTSPPDSHAFTILRI